MKQCVNRSAENNKQITRKVLNFFSSIDRKLKKNRGKKKIDKNEIEYQELIFQLRKVYVFCFVIKKKNIKTNYCLDKK